MIAYRDAIPADGPALAAMARESFTETFGHYYPPADLAAFLDHTFGPGGLPAQLGDPAYRVRVVEDGGTIAGYAKLGPVAFPGDWPADAIELHQLYVLKRWQGTGVGPALLDWAIDSARAGGASELLLSVYVENLRARRLYERRGFVEVGKYSFLVGSTVDDDRIMRLVL